MYQAGRVGIPHSAFVLVGLTGDYTRIAPLGHVNTSAELPRSST